MDRRAFLLGLAASAVATRSHAFGLSAAPDLLGAVDMLSGAREGSGPKMRIIFAPWCEYARKLYIHSRGFTNKLSFVWMPFSGGHNVARASSENLLRTGDPAHLRAIFDSRGEGPIDFSAPLCDRQDQLIASNVAPLVARDIGRGVVSPMLFYEAGRRRVRVIPGAIQPNDFDQISKIAS